MSLSEEQIERYSRHVILKEVGGKGQEQLLKSKVLIIGAGGLGAPAAMYLAASRKFFTVCSLGRPTIRFLKQCLQYMAQYSVETTRAVYSYL